MPQLISELQIAVPFYFKCPISLELMSDPVTLCTGVTYDRASIERWLDNGNNTCPATNQVLQNQELTPNHTLRRHIQEWCVLHQSQGIQRIPTPQPPAEAEKVRSMLMEIVSGRNNKLAVLKSLRNLAKASERNRRCISKEGSHAILVDLISPASGKANRELVQISQEALDILILFELEEDTKSNLLATKLDSICWLLNCALSMETRMNAASLLETLAVDRSAIVTIASTNGAVEGLLMLLREDLCPSAVKTSLRTLIRLSSCLRNRAKIVNMEAIPALVELLPGANRSTTEHVMALLNVLSSCAEGRAAITAHALAIPAIARAMLEVPDATTEHALEILWSICRFSKEEKTHQDLLHLGIFRKLVVLVQMDTRAATKQRVQSLMRKLKEIHGCESSCSSDELWVLD